MNNKPAVFSAHIRPVRRLLALVLLLGLPPSQAAEQLPNRKAPHVEQLTLSQEDTAWLNAHSPIRVGNTPDWVPIEFIDEQGNPDGVAIDYIRRVESLLGIQFEFVQVETWNELIEKVHADEVDLLPSTAVTENRSEFLSFTQPYLSQPIVLFARDSTDYLFDLSHLSHRRLGIVEHFAATEWIRRDYPSIELVQAATIDDMLRDLISGRTDACVDSVLTLSYAIRKGRYSTIKVAGDTPYTIELSMATRKELSRLPALLDKALAAIGKDEQQAILDKWLSIHYEKLPDWTPALKWFLVAIGLLVILLLLNLGWSHVLRRAVSHRTEELNRANRALIELRSKFEAIYNHHYQMTGLMNADGQLLMSNETALKFAGTTAESMAEQYLWEAPGWSHRKNAAQLRDAVQRAKSGEFVQFEAVLVSAEGEPRDFALCITPVFDNDDRVMYLVPEGYDITDRKTAQAALDENQVRLRNLSDNLPGGMTYQMDSGTQGEILKFTYVSAGVDALHELSAEAVLKDADLLYSQVIKEDQPLLAKQQELALTTMKPFAAEVRVRLPSGAIRWRLLQSAPRKARNGHTIWDGIELDITEKREADEARTRLEEQLRQAQKMEAIGQLAGGIAHDFNNILQAVTGHGELALNEMEPDDTAYKHVSQIMKSSSRATDLVRQMLAFSRKQVLQLQPLNLNTVITELAQMIPRVIGEQIEVCIDLTEHIDLLKADSSQLGQVIMNLCVNSRDAMPDGGTITIRTENVLIDENTCRTKVWATEPGPYVLMSVTDTGCGMDEETRMHLFEPFFTTKGVGKGTGLGMATVYGIVQQHSGMITVQSEPESGTKVQIYLPAISNSPTSSPTPKKNGRARGGSETILLAEDDLAVRRLTCQMLERAGYTVIAAKDGEEAIRLYDDHADEVDLALLDVIMPKLGGKAVREHIRKHAPDTRILFCSGYSTDMAATGFSADENMQLLQKPYQQDALLSSIRNLLS